MKCSAFRGRAARSRATSAVPARAPRRSTRGAAGHDRTGRSLASTTSEPQFLEYPAAKSGLEGSGPVARTAQCVGPGTAGRRPGRRGVGKPGRFAARGAQCALRTTLTDQRSRSISAAPEGRKGTHTRPQTHASSTAHPQKAPQTSTEHPPPGPLAPATVDVHKKRAQSPARPTTSKVPRPRARHVHWRAAPQTRGPRGPQKREPRRALPNSLQSNSERRAPKANNPTTRGQPYSRLAWVFAARWSGVRL